MSNALSWRTAEAEKGFLSFGDKPREKERPGRAIGINGRARRDGGDKGSAGTDLQETDVYRALFQFGRPPESDCAFTY